MKREGRPKLFRNPFAKNRLREEADEEVRFHLERRAARFEAEGMDPESARRAARQRFGDVDGVTEEVEETMRKYEKADRTSDRMDDLRRDIGFGVRQLWKNPGFSAIAVLTIAIAIGATTSIFSVVDGVMLRALPYEEPDELVAVWADVSRQDVVLPDLKREWLSFDNYADARDEIAALEALAIYGGWGPTLTGAGEAERLNGGTVSHEMFSEVLRVEPAIGRNFTAEDDEPDAPGLVLLSDGFWKRAFGGDPSVVGTDILLNDQPTTVIGVMPADFDPPTFLGEDAWTQRRLTRANSPGRGGAYLRTIGRLADGQSLETARAQATELGARLEVEYPRENTNVGYSVYLLHDDLVRGAVEALWVLLGAVGFVLLIACVNVANLLIARGAAREGELSVRAAMGAGRGRILSQLLTESLMLAVAGGLLGIVLAFGGTELLVRLAPEGIPRIETVGVDARILGFTALVTVGAGLLFGMLPAVRASRTNPAGTLREGGRGSGGGRRATLRNTLVVGQVALALVLLVGAGLLVQSFQNLQRVDLGFDPEGVVTLQLQMPQARYPDAPSRHAFVGPLEDRLRALPGVESVGSVTTLPLSGQDSDTGFQVEGRPPDEPGQERSVWFRIATPGYFDALGMDVVRGRAFTMSDTDEQPQVIMINETMADFYFDGDAIGKRINLNDPENPTWREIVGVVADTKHFGVRSGSRYALYIPYYQISRGFLFTAVRTSLEPTAMTNQIRREVAALDPSMAVARMQPMTRYIDDALSGDRFTATLLTGFAIVALLLAVVGLFGVVSYSVNTRKQEMGVRIALGAGGTRIRSLVLQWSLGLAAVGVVLGLLGAFGVTRLLGGLLFGVEAADPLTFAGVSTIMALAAVGASMIPAVRATKVDPIEVLKSD